MLSRGGYHEAWIAFWLKYSLIFAVKNDKNLYHKYYKNAQKMDFLSALTKSESGKKDEPGDK